MASCKEYLYFILNQLDGLENISYRAMMGEYIIYYNGKVIGGIYDNKFLVKTTQAVEEYIERLVYKLPYENGKPMIIVDNIQDKEYLNGLLNILYKTLPARRKKKS